MFEILEKLRSTASVDAAFGQPQKTKGRTMIPVSAVQVGMGIGLGQGIAEGETVEETTDEAPGGGGGGGGAGVRPIAMIEVTPDDTIVHPIVDETKVNLAGIALAAWIIFLLLVTIRRVFSEGNDA
jgi:uncharacterized spore protein YtfJ